MTQTTFSDNVLVDGSQDTEQLRVQGHSTQTDPIQTWENSAGDVLAQVTGDGRLIVGDDVTPDSLIEAHRLETSTTKPKRGFHALGQVSGTLATLVQWIVGELELRGSSAIDAVHTALRIRATNLNTGTPTSNAEVRAADVEVINDATAGAAALPKATGLQVAVTNASGKTITDAAALRLKLNNAGTITNPYAIYSEGLGITHLEDFVELKVPAAGVPGASLVSDVVRVYPKSDGKLYAKSSSGTEYDLTGGGGVLPDISNARLTLSSATPVPIVDVLAATLVYLTPYKGNKIALFDGTEWQLNSLSEISIKLTDTQNGTTTNASAIVTGLTDTSQLIVGMEVTGAGIPVGATLSSIDSATQVTLSANATASSTSSLTFKVPHNTVLDIFAFNNASVPKLEMLAWNVPASGNITAITNVASPGVTSTNSLSNDDLVTIINVQGATGANGTWRVASVSGTAFTLKNLDGTAPSIPGLYTSGGTWRRVNQTTSRATVLTVQDDVLVKSGNVTRRYMGTIRVTTTSGQSEDSKLRRFVWNYGHRIRRGMKVNEAIDSWTYATASWRAAANDLANRMEFVCGRPETLVSALGLMNVSGSSSAGGAIGFALDAINTNQNDANTHILGTGVALPLSALYRDYPNEGYHYLQPVEYASATATFYGDRGLAYYQSGWTAELEI